MKVYTEDDDGWLKSLTDDERERFEERAAIKEFCGLLPRRKAEAQAQQEIMRRHAAESERTKVSGE